MTKRNLFRLHKQENDLLAKEVVRFIKDYLYLNNQRAKITIEEFKVDSEFAQPKGKMFDLLVETSDENKFNLCHAAGWSYLQGTKRIENVYLQASNSFHGNMKLASALNEVKHIYQKLS